MTPIDALLDKLAHESRMAAQKQMNGADREIAIREALERELKPLLLAGQAMRDDYLQHAPATTILDWDRAWDRALKGGRDGK